MGALSMPESRALMLQPATWQDNVTLPASWCSLTRMILPNLSGYSLLVVLVTLVVGIITTTINSGKVLGQFQVSPQVLVWLHFVLPMIAGFGTSLQQAGSLSTLNLLNAVITGIYAVIGGQAPGLVVSAGIHAHFSLPKQVAALRAAPANTNAVAVEPPKAA